LSCSATANGTIILQGFEATRITGGAYGHLQQKFHELEILDYISKLKYDGVLPHNIDGHHQNVLIHCTVSGTCVPVPESHQQSMTLKGFFLFFFAYNRQGFEKIKAEILIQ
jgi:hypothetical protein